MGSRGILIINDNGRHVDFCVPDNSRKVLIDIRKKFLACNTSEDAVKLKDRLLNDNRLLPLGNEQTCDVSSMKVFTHRLRIDILSDEISVGMVVGAPEEEIVKPMMWRADLSIGDTWLDGTTGFSGLSQKQFDQQRRDGVSCIHSGTPDFFAGMGNGWD